MLYHATRNKIVKPGSLAACFRIIVLILLFAILQEVLVLDHAGTAIAGVNIFDADAQTFFLLAVDEASGSLMDKAGGFQPVVHGGTVVHDPAFGKCLRFGEGASNSIAVPDAGKLKLDGGFSLEAIVFLEEDGRQNQGGVLAMKIGSFAFEINNYKLNNLWMIFPTEKIFTTAPTQYKYYPVESEAFYGNTTIPVNRWVHLAVTYDPSLKVIRTWIDGGLDRTRYLWRAGHAPLLSEPDKPIEFLRGMRNVRVAGIRLSKGSRAIGLMPPLEAYVHQLPHEDKVTVVVDHIDPRLKLPFEIAVSLEKPNGSSTVVKRVSLDNHGQNMIEIAAPTWKGSLHTLTVKAYSENKIVYSRSVRIVSPKPTGKTAIRKNKSLAVGGKAIFPLVIYHAFPEDYHDLAEIGFNIVMPRDPSLRFMGLSGTDTQSLADIKTSLDEAQKQGVYLMIGGSSVFGSLQAIPLFKDYPALIGWASFDEPWGTLDKVQESYNIVKLLDPDSPIYCTQNNATRFAETAEGADILACDPYPIPNVSLRAVADHTKAAVKAVAGLKPVWTILDQYEGKRPELRELRCMAYLAIISGANGLGIYAWDERRDKKTGWYAKEHPEDRRALESVIRELKKLEAVLIEPNSARKAVFASASSALHAAMKEAGGKTYLFVANDSRKEENGNLTVEGLSDASGICLFEKNICPNIQFRNGKADLSLPALGIAVYEVR